MSAIAEAACRYDYRESVGRCGRHRRHRRPHWPRPAFTTSSRVGQGIVFIIAGFVMPRQIDQTIGQVGLGVWDFGWTAVSYFYLAQIGVGVSINRYVALPGRTNAEGLSRLISSAFLLQSTAAMVVLGLTALSVKISPVLLRRSARRRDRDEPRPGSSACSASASRFGWPFRPSAAW